MLSVNKCCCFFDLKYGVYSYGILSLVLRLGLFGTIMFHKYVPTDQPEPREILRSMMPLLGYLAATTVALFIAMKGIVEERAILIYPYIVVFVFETIVGVTTYFVIAITVSSLYFLLAVSSGSVCIYVLICLISLYKQISNSGRNKSISKNGSILQEI